MPIEILQPQPGGVLGPAIGVQLALPGVPTQPPDTHWRLTISTQAEPETPIYVETRAYSSGGNWSLGYAAGETLLWNDADARLPHGTQARMLVELVNAVPAEASLSQQVVWDTQTGMPWVAKREAQNQAGQGLTFEQSQQLEASVQLAAFGIGGGLGDLVEGALEQLGKRLFGLEQIVPDLQGEGVLTRPGGPYGVNAFGIAWQIISWPEGLGFDEGAPDRTEISYGQLSTMRALSATTGFYPTSSWYMDGAVGSREWAFNAPDQLAYYVLPGVTVRAWWIVLFGPGAATAALANPN